jgi:hypothetical protein
MPLRQIFKTMRAKTMSTLKRFGFVSFTLLTLGIDVGGAEAFVATPFTALSTAQSIATPAAMCGRSCRNGGRYIPGPPDVCYQNGLEYCGSSRDAGPGPGPGIVVPVPGGGVGIGVGPGGPGLYVAPGGNCRTITVERDDGSVRRIRRCD